MDSTSPAGDLASKDLESVTSAGSLNAAGPRVQAENVQYQPRHDGGSGEDVQIHDPAKLGVVPGFAEAADAGAQAEIEKDGHASVDDIKDDVRITNRELYFTRSYQCSDHQAKPSPEIMEIYKKEGSKYARAAAIYTEGLENRVGALETELLELNYQFGSKERPSEERQVMRNIFNFRKCHVLVLISLSFSNDTATLTSACAEPVPLKVMQFNSKDWKNSSYRRKGGKASISLATSAETSSSQLKTFHPDSYSQGLNYQSSDQGVNYDEKNHVEDIRRPGPSDAVRLMIGSPWPLIFIELLGSEHIMQTATLIYPFKHIFVYGKQFRKILELLNETNVDSVEAKDLSQILNTIVGEVIRDSGPKRDDDKFSTTYVSNILRKRKALANHHSKVQHSSPRDLEEQEGEDDTEAQADISSKSPVDGPSTKTSERSTLAPHAKIIAQEAHYICTCIEDARNHLRLLVNTMDLHLGSLLTLRKALRDRRPSKTRFEHLWHLFQPGDLVVTSTQPHQAYRIIHVSGGRPLLTSTEIRNAEARPDFHRPSQVSPFNIDCVRFDIDGEKFGPVQETIVIFEYEEDRTITSLDVYPMSYAEKEGELAKTLLNRGRQFAEYHCFKHKRYEGLSLSEPQEEATDYANNKPQIGLQGATRADEREVYEDLCDSTVDECLRRDHNALVDDTVFDKLQMDRFLNIESRGMFLESRGVSYLLTEDQLILLPYRVHGFSLRSRKWVPLNIDLLRDIEENDAFEGQTSGFDDLVIPVEYKKVVKALVKSHALGSRPMENKNRDRQQVDLIRGKGKGLIILLHGVPGVGKTSTAESGASYTGRPLFPITCGDIGQTASDVERNLEAIFHLARRWGCVLLLDEADVFLAKREKGGDNIDRNALVSVFLRTLEYYSGILFLTTNRIGSFDEAFKSRIHISLYYAPLSESQTFEVWAMNLNRLSKSNRDIYIDKSEIEAFARSHWKDGKRWNGRQIRNAFQTAVALAEYEFQEVCQECEQTGDKPPFRPKLKDRHFKSVATTSAEFDDYLQSVMHGQTHEQKALSSEIRDDTYDPERRGNPFRQKVSLSARRETGSLGRESTGPGGRHCNGTNRHPTGGSAALGRYVGRE